MTEHNSKAPAPVAYAIFAENGNIRIWEAAHAASLGRKIDGQSMEPLYRLREAKVCIVESSDADWAGLYINGKLDCEGHSITAHDLMSALAGMTLTDFEVRPCDIGWIIDAGNLPENLSDVKWPEDGR